MGFGFSSLPMLERGVLVFEGGLFSFLAEEAPPAICKFVQIFDH